MSDLFLPAAGREGELRITAESAGWDYSGLRVIELGPSGGRTLTTGDYEVAVLPLFGSCTVEVDSHTYEVAGRDGVFSGIAGFAYVPRDSEVRISGRGEIALCSAKARRRIHPYVAHPSDIPIEVRGGGVGTRQINNFLSADMFEADRLIAVEVITPEGSWSSYPPHKHDEVTKDEVELEEIYYFRIDGEHGTGFFSCYTTDGEIDETVTVRDGDVYLVPRGYHGPAAATPGHHMYYLNVMAGPAEDRVWKFCTDPVHEWAKTMLEELPPDPRLPLVTAD